MVLITWPAALYINPQASTIIGKLLIILLGAYCFVPIQHWVAHFQMEVVGEEEEQEQGDPVAFQDVHQYQSTVLHHPPHVSAFDLVGAAADDGNPHRQTGSWWNLCPEMLVVAGGPSQEQKTCLV